jgi:hypothetical protein
VRGGVDARWLQQHTPACVQHGQGHRSYPCRPHRGTPGDESVSEHARGRARYNDAVCRSRSSTSRASPVPAASASRRPSSLVAGTRAARTKHGSPPTRSMADSGSSSRCPWVRTYRDIRHRRRSGRDRGARAGDAGNVKPATPRGQGESTMAIEPAGTREIRAALSRVWPRPRGSPGPESTGREVPVDWIK